MENKKGASNCSICLENFYNCPRCLQTFHPKCLSQNFESAIDVFSAGALLRFKCPQCQVDIDIEQIEEIEKLASEDENAKSEAEEQDKSCIIQ